MELRFSLITQSLNLEFVFLCEFSDVFRGNLKVVCRVSEAETEPEAESNNQEVLCFGICFSIALCSSWWNPYLMMLHLFRFLGFVYLIETGITF